MIEKNVSAKNPKRRSFYFKVRINFFLQNIDTNYNSLYKYALEKSTQF